jgi:hypothetical protein
MTPWQGEERRKHPTEVRLALLEQAITNIEAGHKENKESLISVHKRISEVRNGMSLEISVIKKEVALEVKNGLDAIFNKMAEKEKICKEHQNRTTILETHFGWVKAWVLAAWTAILSLGGWAFAHNGQEHITSMLPKIKH